MSITILDKKYKTSNIPFGLQKRLNTIFGKSVNAKEIIEKGSILRNLVGDYVVKRLVGKCRIYVIDAVSEKISKLLDREVGSEVGSAKVRVRTIFEKLAGAGIKVFVKGGLVRDVFMGVDSIDIDAIFDSNINSVKAICDAEGWLIDNISYKFQSMNIGGAKGVSIDLVNLKSTFMIPPLDHEFTVNDLVFDWRANVLIDISGFGVFDAVNRVIRISAPPNLYRKWATNDWKKPLRYFKLLQKGFKPMNPEIQQFIVSYIEKNLESAYFIRIYDTVPRIKHYLIKNITNGEINPNGSYEYGINKQAIKPFLLELKKHISEEAFSKIINILREDSRDKYLTNVIARTLGARRKLTKKLTKK